MCPAILDMLSARELQPHVAELGKATCGYKSLNKLPPSF